MKWIMFRIGPPERRLPVFMTGTQHVIVDQQVGVTQFLGRLCPVSYDDRVVANLLMGKYCTNLLTRLSH